MIPVSADREFTVTYTLNGYLPRTVPWSRASQSRRGRNLRSAARCRPWI